jgi:hypothetical protein
MKFRGHIDPSTGRNRRDKGPTRATPGGPQRHNGAIVRGGRLEYQRARATGTEPRPRPWWKVG